MVQHLLVALFLLLSFVTVSSAQETGGSMQRDSSDTTITSHRNVRELMYFPDAMVIGGIAGSRYVSTAQMAIGVNFYQREAIRLAFAVYIGIHRGVDSTMFGYSSIMLNGQWEPWMNPGRWKTTLIGSVSSGAYQLADRKTNQTVAGIDVRYNFSPERIVHDLPIYVVAIAGFGRDWTQNVNQGFFNVGFALGSFACITFDVSSLITDHNAIMHAGRLR